MGDGPMQMQCASTNRKRPKTATHTHTIDSYTQTSMACNSCRNEEKYLDGYCRPPAGMALVKTGPARRNRRRVTLRVAWWWFPVVVGGGNGIARVGIVHSILRSFCPRIIGQKGGHSLGRTSRLAVRHSLVSSAPPSSFILHGRLGGPTRRLTSRH